MENVFETRRKNMIITAIGSFLALIIVSTVVGGEQNFTKQILKVYLNEKYLN